MNDSRFPGKRPGPDGEIIPVEQCVRVLKKISSSDFFGECTFRSKGGQVYKVIVTQCLTAEEIKKLS